MTFAPPVFADLRNKFGSHLPQNSRHALVTQGYTPKAADEIIRSYRGNLDLLSRQGVQIEARAKSASDEESRDGFPAQQAAESQVSRAFPDTAPDRVLQFQISEGSDARVHFRGRPNRPAIKKLIALLDLSIDTFPAV